MRSISPSGPFLETDLQSLAQASAVGDSTAFEKLYEATAADLFGLAYCITLHPTPSTQAVAQAYTEALRLYTAGSPAEDVLTELLINVRNAAAVLRDEVSPSVPATVRDQAAGATLCELSVEERCSLWLFYAVQVPAATVATVIDRSMPEARERIRSGRAAFADGYATRAFTPEDISLPIRQGIPPLPGWMHQLAADSWPGMTQPEKLVEDGAAPAVATKEGGAKRSSKLPALAIVAGIATLTGIGGISLANLFDGDETRITVASQTADTTSTTSAAPPETTTTPPPPSSAPEAPPAPLTTQAAPVPAAEPAPRPTTAPARRPTTRPTTRPTAAPPAPPTPTGATPSYELRPLD